MQRTNAVPSPSTPRSATPLTVLPVHRASGAPSERVASAAELAHDLRSPMVALLVITEALARGRFGPVTESQQHYLSLLHDAVQGLAQVITETVEQAAQQAREDDGGQVSSAALLDEVRRILQPQADAAGIALRVERGPAVAVRRHRHAILRVLLNLASNAVKFTADGQVALSAHTAGPGRLRFRVRDTGRGCHLPTDAVAVPLRPDERGGGVSTGLGLPMCQRLLASIGSTLVLEPAPTGGSDFSFVVAL